MPTRNSITQFRPPPSEDIDFDTWQPYSEPGRYEGISTSEELSDLSGLPFVFNPPLHRLNKPVYLNVGDPDAETRIQEQWEREGISKDVFATNLKKLAGLRLGRITMGNDGWAFVDVSGGTRYGFRFLYNPNAVTGNVSLGAAIIPNPNDKAMFVNLEGLETLDFQILLNRIPDVLVPNVGISKDYEPAITGPDLRGIRARGTNYDLESLYRVTNGRQMTTIDNQRTADIGLLSPNPVVLSMGNRQYKGRVTGINVMHKLWSPEMVPVLSEVTLSFMRIVSLTETDAEEFATSGGRRVGRPEDFEVGMADAAPSGYDADSPGYGGFNPQAAYKTYPTSEMGQHKEHSDAIASMIVQTAMAANSLEGRWEHAALIGLITAQVESQFTNLTGGDRDSKGVFQQRSAGWGTYAQRTNPRTAIDAFYGLKPQGDHASAPGLIDIAGWAEMEAGAAAQAVQVSGHPGRYATHIPAMTKYRDEIAAALRDGST